MGVRVNGGGGRWGEWGIAEGRGRVAKKSGKVGELGGRSGILFAEPTFEDVAAVDLFSVKIASLARNAEQFFSARVIGLQLIVGDAPIANRVIFWERLRAVFFRDPGK